MIADILKDRTPTQSPRFFLHDEMKAWLSEHLDIQVESGPNKAVDFDLQNKLGLMDTLTVGHHLNVTILLAGEVIAAQGFNLQMHEHLAAFKCLSNVAENCMIAIHKLETETLELKRRLELLENPPL